MKNTHWEAIHEVYSKLEQLCGRSLYNRDNPFYGAEPGKVIVEPVPVDEETTMEVKADDLVEIRAEMRTQLDFLKATIEDQYSERDTYLILFPIVAQIDELIQTTVLERMHTGWPLLQKELFQIDNAGEVFYEIINDILLKPQTPLFIFEVYYFCLNYGFRGRYERDPVKLCEYRNKLLAKLEQGGVSIPGEESEETVHIGHFGSPLWGYLAVAGCLIGVYVFFRLLGRYM